MGEFPWGSRAPQQQDQTGEFRERRPVGLSSELSLRPEQLNSLAALFPGATFEVLDGANALAASACEVVVLAATTTEAPKLAEWLRARDDGPMFVVALDAPEIAATRALMAAGAADVLYPPLSESALTLSLERAFARLKPRGGKAAGRVVALLKAGGGVGATSLGVQTAAILSARGQHVCFADLDIQYGAAAVYLDLPDALSVADCLTAGEFLAETEFTSRLVTHRSGARLLAAPPDVAPLEALDARKADALVGALRQEMALTILDLPSDWTAWTNHLLHVADRIVLVTRLTVGHMQVAKRQLRMLSNQQLDATPLTLVCNAVSSEQQQALPIKAAERALGRSFDLVIPDETRVMIEAINQGVELSARGRSAKLFKSMTALANAVSAETDTSARGR